MEAKLYGQNKGGMSINGIIKDYYAYAGEQISAGDLVEYVNGVAGQTTGTTIETSQDTQLCSWVDSGRKIDAVALDEKRVFIAFHDDASYPYLYGVVCTIEGTKITTGSLTKLNSTENCGSAFSVVLLPSGNVFIAHCYSSNYSYLACTIVSIDGTKITIENFLRGMTNMGMYISACLLPNGNVFISHGYTASGTAQLYGVVCKIDGTTMTFGQTLRLSDVSYSGVPTSSLLLPNGNVFIAHGGYSNQCLYGMIVSISDTTITVGSDTQLSNVDFTGSSISMCLLPNGNVFIAHSYSSSNHLYGIVVAINGTTVTKGADTTLFTGVANAEGSEGFSTCLLPNNKVFIAHRYGWNASDTYLKGLIITVSNTTITKGEVVLLNNTSRAGYYTSALLLSDGVIFVAHSIGANYSLQAQLFGVDETNNIPTNKVQVPAIVPVYETQVRKALAGQFDGVAKTSGIGGDSTGHKDLVSIWTKE